MVTSPKGLAAVKTGDMDKDTEEPQHRKVLKAALRRDQKRLRYLDEVEEEQEDPEETKRGGHFSV